MVEVRQEDRKAAARYWGNDNPPLELQREFARHRLAGVKAGLYAAAEKADELFFGGEDEAVATVIANNIRAIDPASVGADHDAA